MHVEVSGRQFIFPTKCTCCGGTATTELSTSASKSTGKRVVRTKTNEWDIPYCDRCVSHVNLAEGTIALTTAFSVISVVGACVLWYFTSMPVGISIGFLGLTATVFFHKKFMDKSQTICSPDCACVTKAIVYLGWHGSLHQFSILSEDYALAFMTANQKKLVNLSMEARNLLGANEEGLKTNVPRAPRRREN